MVSTRIVISLLTIFCLAAGALEGKVYEYQYQKIIDVEPGLELTIANANGSVTLTTNNDGKLKVDAVKNIFGESREEADLVADHVQIEVSGGEGHFTIQPQYLKIHNRSPSFWQKVLGKAGEPSYGSIDFIISVPVDCNTDIYNASGNIEAAGVRGRLLVSGTAGDVTVRDHQGDIDITTTSGKLTLKDIEGNIHVNANGSDVTFASLTGDIEIRNSSGRTNGEYLLGDLTMSQMTGEIALKHIEGDVRIRSTSGKIMLGQDFGALDVSTESGDIAVRTELN